MTPIEYCRAVRIARARELLEGGDISQKQIGQTLGYKEVASFARAFRKAVGSAPGAYRKRFGRKGISPADFAAKDGSRQKKRIFEAGLQTLLNEAPSLAIADSIRDLLAAIMGRPGLLNEVGCENYQCRAGSSRP